MRGSRDVRGAPLVQGPWRQINVFSESCECRVLLRGRLVPGREGHPRGPVAAPGRGDPNAGGAPCLTSGSSLPDAWNPPCSAVSAGPRGRGRGGPGPDVGSRSGPGPWTQRDAPTGMGGGAR